MGTPQRRLAIIAGPTASGKTAIALAIAARRRVTIINADSAQVYRDIPILSAQPTAEEQARAPHLLFGYRDGADPCSAGAWAADARTAIANCWADDRIPLLVGGTGLYLRALIDGLSPTPPVDVAVRMAVRAMPLADAYDTLSREDPIAAKVIRATDTSRVHRALEVMRATGRSIVAWRAERIGGIGDTVDLSAAILLPDRAWLYARCATRFATMLAQGALDEVVSLRARNLPPDSPALRAIGVAEMSAYLDGRIDQATMIATSVQATRRYAKRQYTWFRHQPPAHWPRIGYDRIDQSVVEAIKL